MSQVFTGEHNKGRGIPQDANGNPVWFQVTTDGVPNRDDWRITEGIVTSKPVIRKTNFDYKMEGFLLGFIAACVVCVILVMLIWGLN